MPMSHGSPHATSRHLLPRIRNARSLNHLSRDLMAVEVRRRHSAHRRPRRTPMNECMQSRTHTALADCARWAIHALAAKLRNPGGNAADITEHIAFAARAMRAYKIELNGSIPNDFLRQAVQINSHEQPVMSDLECLLVGASIVARFGGGRGNPQEEEMISRKLGDWLASACLRRSGISTPC